MRRVWDRHKLDFDGQFKRNYVHSGSYHHSQHRLSSHISAPKKLLQFYHWDTHLCLVSYSSFSLVFDLLFIFMSCLIWDWMLDYLLSSLQTGLGVAVRDEDALADRPDVQKWTWLLLKELLARWVGQLLKDVLLTQHLVPFLSVTPTSLSSPSLLRLDYSSAIVTFRICITTLFFIVFLFKPVYRACSLPTRLRTSLLQAFLRLLVCSSSANDW